MTYGHVTDADNVAHLKDTLPPIADHESHTGRSHILFSHLNNKRTNDVDKHFSHQNQDCDFSTFAIKACKRKRVYDSDEDENNFTKAKSLKTFSGSENCPVAPSTQKANQYPRDPRPPRQQDVQYFHFSNLQQASIQKDNNTISNGKRKWGQGSTEAGKTAKWEKKKSRYTFTVTDLGDRSAANNRNLALPHDPNNQSERLSEAMGMMATHKPSQLQ